MASTWGVSWGSSWGISWGTDGPAPVIISVPYRDGNTRRIRNKQRNLMFQAMTEDEELIMFISDFMKNV